MSRAPTRQQQYIPPFSLWWIGMVHDYYMYVDDAAFVREMLPGVRAVLQFFGHDKRQRVARADAVVELRGLDAEWRSGVPPREADGSSAPLDLQLLLAYDWAARLEADLGSKAMSAEYAASAAQLRKAIRPLYWDEGRRLFADTPSRKQFSQHANVLAVLAASPPATRQGTGHARAGGPVARAVFLLLPPLRALGRQCRRRRRPLPRPARRMGVDALARPDDFRRAVRAAGDPSRSDCHAWSSSPNFEVFRTVLGIDTAAPGFEKVRIRPFLGTLERASGSIPHPKGEVAVTLDRTGLQPSRRGHAARRRQRRVLLEGDPASARTGCERFHRRRRREVITEAAP